MRYNKLKKEMDITTLNKWAFGFFQWIQRVEEIKRLEQY